MLRSAEVFHLVQKRAGEFGVRGVDPETLRFDLPAAMARKDAIVQDIIRGIYTGLEKNSRITFFNSQARFVSANEIQLENEKIVAEKIILAVGSRTAPVNIPGLEEAGYLSNREALLLQEIPASLVIIGGGYIGVEFAQMYSRFGSKVTILGRAPRLMKQEDPELSQALTKILLAEGVQVYSNAPATRVETAENQKLVVARINGEERGFPAEQILFAGGRIARTDELGLEQAGVEMGGAFITVDETLRTSAPHIWSIGDANGGAMFTHRATYDAPIAALNALKGLQKKVDYRVVPRAVFSEPAMASVGLTENEAREAGYEIKVGKHLFAHNGRAKAIGETEGLAKIILEAGSNRILGAGVLGPHADILIHEVAAAMYNRGSVEALSKSIHIHPTLSEVIKSAAKAAG